MALLEMASSNIKQILVFQAPANQNDGSSVNQLESGLFGKEEDKFGSDIGLGSILDTQGVASTRDTKL